MSKDNMIRAWKDPEYRSSPNAQERALLPANPAGTIDHAKLAEVAGGMSPRSLFDLCTVRFCTYLCSWLIDALSNRLDSHSTVGKRLLTQQLHQPKHGASFASNRAPRRPRHGQKEKVHLKGQHYPRLEDPKYRSSLNAYQHALLPTNPAGTINDGKLAEVAGGSDPSTYFFSCIIRFGCTISRVFRVC